jgi:hypothetical protein
MGREFHEPRTCDSLKEDVLQAEAQVVAKEQQLREARDNVSELRRELRIKCAEETQGSHHFVSSAGRTSDLCLVCGAYRQVPFFSREYHEQLNRRVIPHPPRVINLEWRTSYITHHAHNLGGPSNRDRTS